MMTILQLADIHFPAHAGDLVCNEDPEARLTAVLEACRAELPRVDAVVLTGDQVHGGGIAANRRLRQVLTELRAPILAAPGNHDHARSHRAVFGTPGACELGSWRILTWDSCLPGQDHGAVDILAVTVWLDEHDQRPTLFALHHPPPPPTPNPVFRLKNGDFLLETLALYPHVRGVVSGHAHTPFAYERNGLYLWGDRPFVCLSYTELTDNSRLERADRPGPVPSSWSQMAAWTRG